MTRQERIIVLLLASLNFTHMLDAMIMLPLDNYLIPVFHISPRQFSILYGAYSLAAAISGFVAAFVVDRFDRKRVLVVTYVGFIIGTVACGLANSYDLLMVCRVLTGIFGGLIGAQVFSIIGDLFSYERSGMAMGAVMSAFAVAVTIGLPFSLYLTNLFHYNWHVPFLLVGGIGVVLLPITIKILPPVKAHLQFTRTGKSPFRALTLILKSPVQTQALLFTVIMMVGHFLIIPFLTPFMEFNLGFSKNQTPMIYLVGGITSFLAAIFLGKLADKHGKMRVFAITLLLSLVMILAITHMPIIPFSLVLCFFALFFILGTGRSVTAQAMINNVVTPEQRGSFMTFNSSMQQLGTFIASIIAGYIVIEDKTKAGRILRFDWLGYLSIAVLFVSYLLARRLFSKMDRREQ